MNFAVDDLVTLPNGLVAKVIEVSGSGEFETLRVDAIVRTIVLASQVCRHDITGEKPRLHVAGEVDLPDWRRP